MIKGLEYIGERVQYWYLVLFTKETIVIEIPNISKQTSYTPTEYEEASERLRQSCIKSSLSMEEFSKRIAWSMGPREESCLTCIFFAQPPSEKHCGVCIGSNYAHYIYRDPVMTNEGYIVGHPEVGKDKNGWPIDAQGISLCPKCMEPVKAVDLGAVTKSGLVHTKCMGKVLIVGNTQDKDCRTCKHDLIATDKPKECTTCYTVKGIYRNWEPMGELPGDLNKSDTEEKDV